MRRIGIMWRQFFYYSLIIIAVVLVLSFLVSREIRHHYIKATETNLRHQVELVEEALIGLPIDGDTGGINELINKIGKKIGTRITVIKTTGEVIGDSEEDPKNMENHAARPEIREALRGEMGKSIRYSHTLRKKMVYVALPIRRANMIVGVVRASLSLRGVEELLRSINQEIFYWAVILIALALFLSLITSKAFTKPIRRMVQATKGIAGRDFTTRVSTKRRDELGELAYGLNWMTEEIERLFAEITTEKEELTAILSSMIEGVVVLDPEGRIVLTNEGFRDMCGLPASESVIGRHYWEMLRSSDFKQLIDEVREKGRAEAFGIRIGDRVYLGNASLIPKREKRKTIAVLHDITEIKRLEQLKSEFVANASHELRTPLTVIKGFVETLGEKAKGEDQHFLGIVRRHTDRMINLVSDLSLLSQLEDREQRFKIKAINLQELASDVMEIFKERAKKKGLKLEFLAPDEFPLIKGDPFFIEQVFVNLLDNAVKYTGEGEIRIELSELNKEVKIEVSDTGIGIPKQHLSRIFERFYTVDKARSRELGGTGLGLSIVKHIVLAHNGRIDVESQPGKGSKFIVTLPKEQS